MKQAIQSFSDPMSSAAAIDGQTVAGIAYGDVSNMAVRNILTEISKRIAGRFTVQEMYDTLDYFDWRCPYTGKDLRPLIEAKVGAM